VPKEGNGKRPVVDGDPETKQTLDALVADRTEELLRVTESLVREVNERERIGEALEEQLRFERLLSEVSARFVNVTPERLDGEIENALKTVLDFFQVDRCALIQSMLGKTSWRITHAVSSSQCPPVPVGVELSRSLNPWAYQTLLAGHVVRFSNPDESPAEAEEDRATWQKWGIRSNLTIPILTGASVDHVIALNSVVREREWPDEFIPRLRLLGEIFVNALERRSVEHALRESEERLSLATASAETGIWIMDTGTGSVWVTDKLRDLFRFAPDEELSFEQFAEVIYPDDRGRVKEAVRKSMTEREPLHIEYRIVHPDGDMRWIAARGRIYPGGDGLPVRLMGVSSDITQRKMTELHLMESRAVLSALINSTSDLIWSVDAERFGLLTFNRGLSEYFFTQRGIRIEAGMRPEDLFPPGEFVRTWQTYYRTALKEGSYSTEYRVYAGTRTLLLNLNRLERGGEVFGVSVFGKDITERKAMEARLLEQLAEIEQLRLQLEKENLCLREELGQEKGFGQIIGKSDALNYVLFRVGQVAPTDATVLILGETGTGKGMVANAIHAISDRGPGRLHQGWRV